MVIKQKELEEDFNWYSEKALSGETVIVELEDGKSVVLISEKVYNEMNKSEHVLEDMKRQSGL